ncbi:MAG: OmpA family protein [Bacteroidota bacterium]
MMHRKHLLLVALLLSFASFYGCVSSKKYEALRADNARSKMERDSVRRALDENRHVQYDLQRTEAQVEEQEEKYTALKEQFGALNNNYKALLDRYDELIFQNQTLLASSSEEVQTLNEELTAKQLELDKKERKLRQLELNLIQKENDLKEMGESTANNSARIEKEARAQCEQQLNQLTSLLEAKDAKLNTLRSRINQALLGFSDDDLSVSESNGRIYVTMSQNLLFASGSDRVDWKGKQALQKLTEVLKRNTDIQVNVEGHTDSDGSAAQNWDLSVRRSTAVVKILTGYGLNPKQVVASGRSFYQPVASNNSSAGKARNRRTEIILSPKLDELYDIINQ